MKSRKIYKSFVLLPNHKKLDRYQAGFIIIEKIIASNTIIRIQYGKSYNTNLTLLEAKKDLAQAISYVRAEKGAETMSYLITNMDNDIYGVKTLRRDVYNIKDETKLIKQYMANQHYLKRVATKFNINPFKLDLNKGVILVEGDITKLRLDYGVIPTYVIPTMYALDAVIHNRAGNILELLEE